MAGTTIQIKGARVHNLKNVNLDLPKDALICFTGVSGSGKSSLAFDTLYAEGQRRYVESLSAYARQFLGQMQKPDVDRITGLAPAISIEQKAAGLNPRSTVGTITEIYDFLRVLYARVGVPHCTKCGERIGAQTLEQIVARILALPEGTRMLVMAPVIQGRRGEYRDLFEDLRRQGYLRARVNGEVVNLSEDPDLDRNMRHTIEVVTDRLVMRDDIRTRLVEAVEGALHLGQGTVMVQLVEDGRTSDLLFSTRYACNKCDLSYEEPTPQLFSFNSPQGMCANCHGLGTMMRIEPRLIVPDPSKSINEGAIEPLGTIANLWKRHFYEGIAGHVGFSLDTPWERLSEEARRVVLYGLGYKRITFTFRNGKGGEWSHKDRFNGVVNDLEKRYHTLKSQRHKAELERYMAIGECDLCHGERLKPEALSVTLGGLSIAALCRLPILDIRAFFEKLSLSDAERQIGDEALKEIVARLDFLLNVGLEYLTLERTAPTLSGGEAQRIRLASQIGRGLVGVMYVLDEPSIGLHPRDNRRLLDTLGHLRDQGNTVIIVEHDEETMWASDHIVDFGPGAGVNGGEIVAEGRPGVVAASTASLTGQYLCGKKTIPVPASRRGVNDSWLTILGARQNNLKNLDVRLARGPVHLRHGRIRFGQELADQRYPVRGPGPVSEQGRHPTGRVRRPQGRESPGQGHQHRSGAHRPHAEIEPGDLYEGLRRDPRPLRRNAGGQVARLQAGPFQLQRAGRPVRGLRRQRRDAGGDGFPGGHVGFLSRLRGQAVRPGNPGGEVQGAFHRRRARPGRAGSAGDLRTRSFHRPGAPDPLRRGPGVYQAGPARAHAVGRRGAAHQAGTRTVQAQHGADHVRAGRTHDRPALRRHHPPARRAERLRGQGQHRRRHRAQHRRDQDRRLDHRPGAGGRRSGRTRHRRGHAGDRRGHRRIFHRPDPGQGAAAPHVARASIAIGHSCDSGITVGRRPGHRRGWDRRRRRKNRRRRRQIRWRGWDRRRTATSGRSPCAARGNTT